MRTATPAISFSSLMKGFDSFFAHPYDRRLLAVVRILFGCLLFLNVGLMAIDAEYFLGSDGVLPFEVSQRILDPDAWTAFSWFSDERMAYVVILSSLMVASLMLSAGLFTQVAALVCWLGWTSVCHRAIFLFDGEDVLFRLIAFFFVLGKSDDFYSISAWWRKRQGKHPANVIGPSIIIRYIQIQFTIIYVATAWEKARGYDWTSGNALYYVVRLDDLFGYMPAPLFLFEYVYLLKFITWSVLIYESVFPIFLWMKNTRPYAVVVGMLFHLGLGWNMNLFLFQPLMMVALFSFVEPKWLAIVGRKLRIIRSLSTPSNFRDTP